MRNEELRFWRTLALLPVHYGTVLGYGVVPAAVRRSIPAPSMRRPALLSLVALSLFGRETCAHELGRTVLAKEP